MPDRWTQSALLIAPLIFLALVPGATAQTAQPPASPGPAAGGASRSIGATSIQDVARLEGQGESVLRGIGIVVGLAGTGDSGDELVLAEPLAQVYASNGIPLPNLAALGKARTAALVWVDCTVPREGARLDDVLPVTVSVMHTAKSLKGGRLILTPLLGPLPRQGHYAIASGSVIIPDPDVPTAARILTGSGGGGGGARITREIKPTVMMASIAKGRFRLIVEPYFRSWSTTHTIASQINGLTTTLDETTPAGVATALAIDDATVEVTIPERERSDPSNFLSTVMTASFSPSLLDLPAQVVCDVAKGVIIVTGDAEISPVNVTHADLTVTTTTPPPVPTQSDPIVDQRHWVTLQTTGRAGERARVQDLLDAFRQIDVPIEDQIAILTEIHKAGRLHARLVIE